MPTTINAATIRTRRRYEIQDAFVRRVAKGLKTKTGARVTSYSHLTTLFMEAVVPVETPAEGHDNANVRKRLSALLKTMQANVSLISDGPAKDIEKIFKQLPRQKSPGRKPD
jgi:hypothetical protein